MHAPPIAGCSLGAGLVDVDLHCICHRLYSSEYPQNHFLTRFLRLVASMGRWEGDAAGGTGTGEGFRTEAADVCVLRNSRFRSAFCDLDISCSGMDCSCSKVTDTFVRLVALVGDADGGTATGEGCGRGGWSSMSCSSMSYAKVSSESTSAGCCEETEEKTCCSCTGN